MGVMMGLKELCMKMKDKIDPDDTAFVGGGVMSDKDDDERKKEKVNYISEEQGKEKKEKKENGDVYVED
ncbi:hypothetical protein BGZ49_003003 [Haplosporangium sp. Z 27]|nr:hypothetical protein BGZ49_003003 [Haplosporangium sp. Z 27]